jgi:hypothetical protein
VGDVLPESPFSDGDTQKIIKGTLAKSNRKEDGVVYYRCSCGEYVYDTLEAHANQCEGAPVEGVMKGACRERFLLTQPATR